MEQYSKTGLAFLAGAVAGIITGILLAPDKGSETRRKISGKATAFGDLVKGKANDGFQFANNFKERMAKEYVD